MGNQRKLPQYRDDEVRVFHPLFAEVLNRTLLEMGLQDELEVVHHWTTKGFSGIIDFAICNKKSKKVLLPIEVKKSVLDLKALGRRQARGYLTALGMYRGSDYYVATNLEYVELFRDSETRVLTMAQLLKLDRSYIGELRDSDFDDFNEKLQSSLRQVLEVVRGNDGSEYASNISGLLHALETSIDDSDSWHQAQTFYAFDYIRGALSSDYFFRDQVSSWDSAESFISKPGLMSDVVSEIDFDLLFQVTPKGRFNDQEVAQISAGAFEAGMSKDNGQDLATVINEIAYSVKGIPGVVETTPYLAELLVAHASISIGPYLDENLVLMEPGCGSGNLLAAAKNHFESLSAKQIFGIEKEELFREILSLRVGLIFKDSLRNGHRPDLSIRKLESLIPENCSNVGLVLMNPPFIRGIDCVSERKEIATKISKLTNLKSSLTGEQLGYECGYLELVLTLVPQHAVIATIFPKNSLLRADSKNLREFLVEDFGLEQIVVYKDNNLFGSVQKSTVLLIGSKGAKVENVTIYNYSSDLENLDFHMYRNAEERKDYISANARITSISSSELQELAAHGWKSIFDTSESSYKECMQEMLACTAYEKLREGHQLTRGSIGNKGASDFLFNPKISSQESRANPPQFWTNIPEDWILPAAKNADSVPREITSSQGESGIHIPRTLEAHKSQKKIDGLVFQKYLEATAKNANSGKADGSQRKEHKSEKDLVDILEVSNPISGDVVLIPRAQRAAAQISISSTDQIMVSTNFFVAFCESRKEAIFLGSWLLSLFGQIQLEYSGIDQEGMRKLEKNQIGECLIPFGIQFSEEESRRLEEAFLKAKSVTFRAISTRELDEIWAKKLSPNNWENLLSKVSVSLRQLCNERLEI